MAEHKPHPSNVPGDFYVENKRGAAKKSEKIWKKSGATLCLNAARIHLKMFLDIVLRESGCN